MKKIVFFMLMLVSVSARAEIKTQTVMYKHGNALLNGHLVFDDRSVGKRPAVLVVHAWMGLDDYSKKRAQQLAELGYVAMVADIYGPTQQPADTAGAAKLAGFYKSDRLLLRGRVNAALEALKKQPMAEAKKIAAIGYCFGGTTVLELARAGADVQGVISFHGGLDSPSPQDAKNIRARILALHGADDPFVSASDITAFENEMREAKVDWQLIKYGGAVHSFTDIGAGNDNSKGAAYNATADRRSWLAMREFLTELFQ